MLLFLNSNFSYQKMNIAAIDVSSRLQLSLGDYEVKIYNILASLKFPLRIIQWSDCIQKDEIYEKIEDFFDFKRGRKTVPKSFMRRLPSDQAFELYLFTNGKINDKDVKECRYFLKRRNIQVTQIHLHYIGNADEMNLKFTDVFYGYPQMIYFDGVYKATIDPNINNLEDVDYHYIMKDDSLKSTILTQINSPDVDNYHLKNEVILLTTHILEEYFEKKRDNIICISFVERNLYDSEKIKFLGKMSEILKLFEKYVDTYSLKHFVNPEQNILQYENDAK